MTVFMTVVYCGPHDGAASTPQPPHDEPHGAGAGAAAPQPQSPANALEAAIAKAAIELRIVFFILKFPLWLMTLGTVTMLSHRDMWLSYPRTNLL